MQGPYALLQRQQPLLPDPASPQIPLSPSTNSLPTHTSNNHHLQFSMARRHSSSSTHTACLNSSSSTTTTIATIANPTTHGL
jgi:hypothetical protein